jgi:hypothetical protein
MDTVRLGLNYNGPPVEASAPALEGSNTPRFQSQAWVKQPEAKETSIAPQHHHHHHHHDYHGKIWTSRP